MVPVFRRLQGVLSNLYTYLAKHHKTKDGRYLVITPLAVGFHMWSRSLKGCKVFYLIFMLILPFSDQTLQFHYAGTKNRDVEIVKIERLCRSMYKGPIRSSQLSILRIFVRSSLKAVILTKYHLLLSMNRIFE